MSLRKQQVKVSRRLSGVLLLGIALSGAAWAQCTQPANPIVAENCLTGNPDTEWDINGAGDTSIQGFATDISVNVGQTIYFKVNTNAKQYHLDIYRMGYYGGMGARKVVTVNPSAPLPQTQPACLTDASTKLLDCGNWAVSASWAVPSTAVSGIYFARLVRPDTGGASHMFFIVRNDASHAAILYQASDLTWQAYNNYGGNSLYGDAGFALDNRAYKVSYNRPYNTRSLEYNTWLFNAEYPMIRWLESNGYDLSYFTGVDAVRNAPLILNHKVYLSSGHDEYWSGPQRSNVEAARDAGVNLAFFSGNEVFWKTRWENSIDGTNAPYRTMVCYKETLAGAKIDPSPTWTGTWRDPRFSPPADGGRPENAFTGTIFTVNGLGPDNNNNLSIQVTAADGKLRFWRNTSIASLAPGQVAALPPGTLGYEWDSDLDNGSRPPGLIPMSTATYPLTVDLLLDYGATYGAGTTTHRITLYRAPSGALVFGAGTVQWAWGLDSQNDCCVTQPDIRMQQATVNLFADMGVQPGTLQAGLVAATKSTDTTPPYSLITSPANGSTVTGGNVVSVSGTANDLGGGVVGGVEVSVDGGQTWHPASGRESWTFNWTPSQIGVVTIQSRAVDDSGNIERPSAGSSITVAPHDCPCTTWSPSIAPVQPDSGDANPVEVGVKFHADFDGYITGIRFYKSAANTGTHTGHLWSSTGALLGSATFTSETSTGWQQVNFVTPISITANATYTASYFAPVGHYSATAGYFTSSSVDNPPIHFPSGSNGVYVYSNGTAFPTSSYVSANYWVDVVYIPAGSMPGAPPALLALPSSVSFAGYVGVASPAAKNISVYNQGSGGLTWTAAANANWIVLSPASGVTPATLSISANVTGLAAGTYNGIVTITSSGGGPAQTVAVTLTVSALLMSSDFNNGNMQGWVVSPLGHASDWSVVNQALQYDGNGHTQLYSGNSAWTNYSLQADVKFASLNDFPGGIRGRVNPSTGAAYAVWFYPAEGLVRLYKNVAWNIDTGFTQLGQAAATFDTQNFHTVRLSFQGSQIQVFYDGNLLITATDTGYAQGMIALDVSSQPITFDNVIVSAPTSSPMPVVLTPASLSFSGSYGGTNPAAQSVQVSSGGAGVLVWTAVSTAPWLSASLASGVTPASLQLAVNTSGLVPGTYSGSLSVTAPGASNNPQSANVTLTVVAPPPSIVLSPSTGMSFVAVVGQGAPTAQSLTIANGAGYGSLAWTATASAPWLTLSAASGSTPSNVGVNVNASGLVPGVYTGTITISASGVANSPQSVAVSLAVFNNAMTETFSGGATGWVISPMGLGSGWSVSNGAYSYSGIGLSQSCAGNAAWTDYSFDTNVKLSNLNNFPGGVRGRVNPATGAGYAVWLYPGSNTMILYGVPQWNINGAGLAALAQASYTPDAAAYHDLRMVFQGNQISVYWDGNLMMRTVDSSYAAGYVCMDVDSQPISYQNVRVAAMQNAVTVSASPSSLTFSSAAGSTPAPQTVAIGAGGATTTWAITTAGTWLTASASSTMTPGSITVSVNPVGLANGTYNGSVTVFAPGAATSPLVIPVTLAVTTAALSTAPSALTFFGATDSNPQSQNISITNAGTGSLSWNATAGASWIGLGTTSGIAPASLAVSASSTSLPVGTYSGNVTISSASVGNGPAIIPVTLQVGTSLFTDTFSSSANWTASPLGNAAGWSVINNTFQYNGGGHTQQYAGSPSWTNYTVATDFMLSSLNDFPGGLRGRVNTVTGACYGVWVYPAEGLLKLFRIGQWNIDTDLTLLATSPVAINASNSHNLRLSFNGTQITVYYDGALAIQAVDSSYSQGAIALDVSNQPIAFSNVKVIGF